MDVNLRNKTAEDSLAKKLILNTYKTLLTRGKKVVLSIVKTVT